MAAADIWVNLLGISQWNIKNYSESCERSQEVYVICGLSLEIQKGRIGRNQRFSVQQKLKKNIAKCLPQILRKTGLAKPDFILC